MERREINYLRVLAEERNISRASERLAISQPGLSSALKRIEERFGVALFERNVRGITLTSAGHVLLRRLDQFQAIDNDVRSEMQDCAAGTSGSVRIGVGLTLLGSIVPRALGKLLGDQPHLKVSLQSANYPELMLRLQKGGVDAVLSVIPGEVSAEYQTIRLGDDPFVVACSRQHPRKASLRTLKAISQERWIGTDTSSAISAWAQSVFSRAKLPMPQPTLIVESLLPLTSTLARTDLLALVPRRLLQQPEFSGHLCELPIPQLIWHHDFGFTLHKDKYQNPVLKHFIEAVKAVAKSPAEKWPLTALQRHNAQGQPAVQSTLSQKQAHHEHKMAGTQSGLRN